MKLELKHLAPYLPYNLKWIDCAGFVYDTNFITKKHISVMRRYPHKRRWHNTIPEKMTYLKASKRIKPILKPISDLTNKKLVKLFNDENIDVVRMKYGITINYRMMSEWFKEHISLRSYNNDRCLTMSAWLYIILLERHYDVFGLIEKGLAIDINTLNQ